MSERADHGSVESTEMLSEDFLLDSRHHHLICGPLVLLRLCL